MNADLAQQAAETLSRALACDHRLDRASMLEEALRLNRLAQSQPRSVSPSDDCSEA